MTFQSAHPHHVRHPQRTNSSGLSEPRKSTLPVRGVVLNYWFFQISPNPPRTLPMHDVINIPGHILSLGFLFWHLWMTHSPRARVNTCAQVCTELTHVLSRKVLSLIKPKGKIYKTKSLCHYITMTTVFMGSRNIPSAEDTLKVYWAPSTGWITHLEIYVFICHLLTLDRTVTQRILCTGRTCVNERKQSCGLAETYGRFEMIYADAHVRYGQSCSGQLYVESSSQQKENNGQPGAKALRQPPVEYFSSRKSWRNTLKITQRD